MNTPRKIDMLLLSSTTKQQRSLTPQRADLICRRLTAMARSLGWGTDTVNFFYITNASKTEVKMEYIPEFGASTLYYKQQAFRALDLLVRFEEGRDPGMTI